MSGKAVPFKLEVLVQMNQARQNKRQPIASGTLLD